MKIKVPTPAWTIVSPLLACVLLILQPFLTWNYYPVLLGAGLIATVMAAVHHAEMIAHKIGEPYGTLLLAVAITVIEVSLIVSLMLVGGKGAETLARDTVFAAIMLILTGIIGLCLLLGGYRFKEQRFGQHGVGAALVTLTAITVLTLVLPNHTTSILGPVYSQGQLLFIAVVCLILYGTFVAIQTGRHSDYFLPSLEEKGHHDKLETPSNKTSILSLLLLLVSLVAVVVIAKILSPAIEKGVNQVGAPKSLVGVIVAFVILLPEGLAALRAAGRNHLQTSLNLALGSALASIGLTIPAVAIVSIFTGLPVTLGIDSKSTLLLLLSLFTIMLSFGTGRTTLLQGVVLLVIFAVYLFTTVVP